MPANGKHRRTRTSPVMRRMVAIAAGGVVVALPLIGATGARAAESSESSVATAKSVLAVQTKAAATTKTYTVTAGDSLATIAKQQHVPGGWKQLYADNRATIGPNPSLIHAGLKLVIRTQAPTPAVKAAKPATATKAAAVNTGYTTPVTHYVLGTPYHQNGPLWASGYHTGTDFVVPSGTSVHAVAAGTVVTAGWGGSYGNQVVIRHSDGYYSQYAHLSSLSVSAGQTVAEGEQIGLSGATGNVTGPHLHFEIRTGPDYGSDVDPVAYLRAHGVTV